MLLCEVGDPGLNVHRDHHTQWCENENNSINMGDSKCPNAICCFVFQHCRPQVCSYMKVGQNHVLFIYCARKEGKGDLMMLKRDGS